MIYSYVCHPCEEVIEVNMSMQDDHPKFVSCPKCGKNAYRNWMLNVHVPEHFKAMSESNSDSSTSLDHLKSRFKHSHPSGRDTKIYY